MTFSTVLPSHGYAVSGDGRQAQSPAAHSLALEKHFSPRFFAELWGVSESTIVRWFRDEPGVLKLSRKQGTRTRCELRIPLAVALRVYQERIR
jgi:hypothetical protein